MTAPGPSPRPSPQPQPLLDVHGLLVAVRRRRRFWVAFGLLGLLLGAAVAVLIPPQPTAIAQLLIIHENEQPSGSESLMETDVALLETTRIAALALEKLGSGARPEEFLKSYEGTPVTGNVLQLTVRGPSDDDARRRAEVLAEVFITDHVQRIQSAADAEAQALLDQRTRAEEELSEVDSTITSMEAALETGTGTAAGLETLYGRRAGLAAQISDLGSRAEEAAIGAPRVAAGTQVVDAPRVLPGSLLTTIGLNGVIGLVLGLVTGLALTAVTSVVRDRPVLRRAISEHLGASVIAQLQAPRRAPLLPWRRSAVAAQRRRVATTLARLVHEDEPAVSLLSVGCPRITAALSLDVARALAADRPVTIVDDLPGQDLAAGAGDTDEASFRVVDAAEGVSTAKAPDRRERRIGVGSVEPGTAWTDLARLGAETLLVVRAGHASTTWLHTVARQLADTGIAIIGVVLVDPDPRDHSDGTLWNGLHTALRGRAGTSTKAPSANGNGNGSDLPTRRFAPVTPTGSHNGDLGVHTTRTQD